MKKNAAKNRKLIEQYPFIKRILYHWMEPFTFWVPKYVPSVPKNLEPGILRVDNLTIKVERADGDLMLRQADNIGIGDNSFIAQMSEDRKDQVMRRGEYIFATGMYDNILHRLDWPRNRGEVDKEEGEIYAKLVFWETKLGPASYTGYIGNEVEFLVWVRVETWHVDTKNDDPPGARFGECLERSVHLTIYGKPRCGFPALESGASVYQNLRLNSSLLTRGILDKDRDLISIGGMLYEMCIGFQDEVYFNGMKEVLDNGKFRGASGQFGPVKVLCAEMCGYDRVMLQDANSWISLQLRPGEKHMYVLGQDGTLPQIRNLVKTVVKMWNEKPEVRQTFKSDEQVSVI